MGASRVTIGYIDASAVAVSLSPGSSGDRAAAIWASFDAACTSTLTEVEVPSLIGRSLDRVAWVWAMNTLSVVLPNDLSHRSAVDLAWLGAPASVALHVAAAETIQADHFLTADFTAAQWADIRGLNVITL